MKRKVRLRTVTGDENLVTRQETYVEYDSKGNIVSIKQRDDSGRLITVMEPYIPVIDYSKMYLTFKALEDSTFKITRNATQYSLDGGKTWTSLAANTASPTVLAGTEICWKATGLTPVQTYGIGTFSSTGNFEVYGNIMSLISGDDFSSANTLANHNFARLFYNSTKVISAFNLVLPADILSQYCYSSMFYGCTALEEAPSKLPAMHLAYYCYASMFSGATSLTVVPDLPATTGAMSCYSYMFKNCRALTVAPKIAVTIFGGRGLFEQMFANCKGLTEAPDLIGQYEAGLSGGSPYREMFSGCTNLNKVRCLSVLNATDSSEAYNWLSNVSETGTFIKAAGVDWYEGVSGIPTGWTVIEE